MGQNSGKRSGLLLIGLFTLVFSASSAAAQSIIDRVSFRVPPLVVAWSGPAKPVRGADIVLPLDASGCVAFASNTAVVAQLENAGADWLLKTSAIGRSAQLFPGADSLPARTLSFPRRTARVPDDVRHQALTLCLYRIGTADPAPAQIMGLPPRVRFRTTQAH